SNLNFRHICAMSLGGTVSLFLTGSQRHSTSTLVKQFYQWLIFSRRCRVYLEMSDRNGRFAAHYLEDAGFVDENGNLGRPVPSGMVVVPVEVWLERGVLRWRMGDRPQQRQISRNMINQFVRLRTATSILEFAKRWGVLAIGKGDYSEDRRTKLVSTTLWA